MNRIMKFAVGAAMATTMATSFGAVQAATPPDTLVHAWQIDDILSLDPGELFEFSAAEITGNTYERLVSYDYRDVSKISGEVAESWTVSPDGKTFTFKIRQGKKFASGNPLTAEDVAYSFQRAVALDKSPAFILGQFGLTKENVKDKVKQTGPFELTMELDKPYAPTFVLYCLTAPVASIVDKKLVAQNEKDGDFGNAWLKTHYAGSGPFTIRDWKANEVVVLERNNNYEKKTPLARVVYRHIKETATQRLLLEKGDVDIARNLNPEELAAVSKNSDIKIESGPKGTVYYLGLNQKNPNLAKPEVREALKYLVDYAAIADTIMKNKGQNHQAFLPKGFLGASSETPYKLDVAKAKELLAKAGLPNGFSVTMDIRIDPGHHGHRAGDPGDVCPGRRQARDHPRRRQPDADQVPRPPARHLYRQLGLGLSGSATPTPTPSRRTRTIPTTRRRSRSPGVMPGTSRPLTAQDPRRGPRIDAEKRAAMYDELQKAVLDDGPFVIILQQIEVAASRKNVDGFILGPSFDTNSVAQARKN